MSNKKSNVVSFPKSSREAEEKNYKEGLEINCYDVEHVLGKYIKRANNPNKSLQGLARTLVIFYWERIENSSNGVIFVTHEEISDITRRSVTQTKNYHKQLRDLFDIQYHKSVMVDDKKCREGFTIQFTDKGKIILRDLFDESFIIKELNNELKLLYKRSACSMEGLYYRRRSNE